MACFCFFWGPTGQGCRWSLVFAKIDLDHNVFRSGAVGSYESLMAPEPLTCWSLKQPC